MATLDCKSLDGKSLAPLAVDDIERIEIIRGPNAVTYGANAFFGVVNIITRHPAQDQGTEATVVAGGPSQGELLLRHGGKAGNVDYHFTLGYRENNGFPDLPDTSRARLFTLRGDYALGMTDQLQLQFGANSGPREQGTTGSLTDPPRPRDVEASFVQLRWQRTLSAAQAAVAALRRLYRMPLVTITILETMFASTAGFICGQALNIDWHDGQRASMRIPPSFRCRRALAS